MIQNKKVNPKNAQPGMNGVTTPVSTDGSPKSKSIYRNVSADGTHNIHRNPSEQSNPVSKPGSKLKKK
ncbi:hypothetical protein [Methanospirillum lacunae]|uniref:hypothetical protein n=1 Tax=Methanospirillum lacunae TaxID=668570 RepID=UPI0038FCBA0A